MKNSYTYHTSHVVSLLCLQGFRLPDGKTVVPDATLTLELDGYAYFVRTVCMYVIYSMLFVLKTLRVCMFVR